MKILYILLSFVYILSIEIEFNDKIQDFIEYTKKYNKEYPTKEEFQKRYQIWKQNFYKIESTNKNPLITPLSYLKISPVLKFKIPTVSYRVNKFTDLTKEEFSSKYLTFSDESIKDLPIKTSHELGIDDIKEEEIPENFDWEFDRGIITKIKDQGSCGACFAFATVGIVQSQYLKNYGENISFSEQQIIDCDELSYGCGGGNFKKTFTYLKNNGLMKEEDYPYIMKQGNCYFNESKALTKVKNFAFLPKDEEEMKKYLYRNGPIVAGMNANILAFYDKGIIEPLEFENCSDKINHAVLIVGYGVDKESGKKYWRIKNSMGQDWGEDGYFKLLRGEGVCKINTYVAMAEIQKLK